METKRTNYFREYMANYRTEKPEIVRKAQKSWREKNKAHNTEYMREYRARKKAEQLAQAK